jgi:Rieske Fe-S protein
MRRIVLLAGAAALAPIVANADQASQSGSTAASGKWTAIGPSSKLKQEDFSQVDCGDYTLFVAKLSDDSVLAISSECTHLGCGVLWDHKSLEFHCPCHGGKYDSTGKNIAGPPKRPLQRFATRIDSTGIVEVLLPGQ